MTPGEAVANAHRLWVDDKRTGNLVFNYRHGVLKHVEHQMLEFPEGASKSARSGQNVPTCPACGAAMTSRDAGTLWTCQPCAVKRTVHQLRREA